MMIACELNKFFVNFGKFEPSPLIEADMLNQRFDCQVRNFLLKNFLILTSLKCSTRKISPLKNTENTQIEVVIENFI